MNEDTLKTGITWHRGQYLWYACLGGHTCRGKTRHEALGKLETLLNKHSSHPIYLFNF